MAYIVKQKITRIISGVEADSAAEAVRVTNEGDQGTGVSETQDGSYARKVKVSGDAAAASSFKPGMIVEIKAAALGGARNVRGIVSTIYRNGRVAVRVTDAGRADTNKLVRVSGAALTELIVQTQEEIDRASEG